MVVVAEHTLDGGRVLEGVARHVGVEHVETAQPPAVDHGLIDIVFRSVHVGSVIDPPLVVGGHGILVGGGSILKVAGVTVCGSLALRLNVLVSLPPLTIQLEPSWLLAEKRG